MIELVLQSHDRLGLVLLFNIAKVVVLPWDSRESDRLCLLPVILWWCLMDTFHGSGVMARVVSWVRQAHRFSDVLHRSCLHHELLRLLLLHGYVVHVVR